MVSLSKFDYVVIREDGRELWGYASWSAALDGLAFARNVWHQSRFYIVDTLNGRRIDPA